ncbi:MAG: type II secretion system F family protein, partial [Gemmatimonadaceae bacterium]
MVLALILLVSLGVFALAVATYVVLVNRYRREVMGRTLADSDFVRVRRSPLLEIGTRKTRLLERILGRLPLSWLEDSTRYRTKLLHAGHDGATASRILAILRVLVLVTMPVFVVSIAPHDTLGQVIFWSAVGVVGAFLLPIGVLDMLVKRRQETLRRSLPDALDLLVVCVEAGVSLDAAILRVSREMMIAHGELAKELTLVNRKVNAGMPREEALRGLWTRTGVEELRSLASSMIQSEKLGTSIAKVLRISS